MNYGYFDNEGSQYVINTPVTPDSWENYLFNDEYYMTVSQAGYGTSSYINPNPYKIGRGYRQFYLYDHQTKECWNPNYRPLKVKLDSYKCIHALGYTEIQAGYHGILTSAKVFVPLKGMQEIWIHKIKNNTIEAREISQFSAYSLANHDGMGSKGSYDAENDILTCTTFPYHVLYHEYEALKDNNSTVYMLSDCKPTSFETSERRFFGSDDITELPTAILNGECSNLSVHADRFTADKITGVFQHKFVLQPGEEVQFVIVVGCTGRDIDNLLEIKKQVLQEGSIQNMLGAVLQYWENICNKFIIHTPDNNLDYFMNYWLKKQLVFMTRCNRLSAYCPVRNQLQDAMGYSMLDPDGATDFMLEVMKIQETNGYLHQWHFTDGSAPKGLCLLRYNDAPTWLVSCFSILIQQTGNLALLDYEIAFVNSEIKASVYEHLLRAIYYLAEDTGEHGLCHMADGDWTDPINGPGREGAGESAWTTMALIYAIKQFLPLCREKKDDDNVKRLEKIAESLDEAVNQSCWDGEWYVTSIDDAGEKLGTNKDDEGKIFLNAQSWAIMSGVAKGDRLSLCKKTIDSLDTPFGPLLLYPSFSKWNPKWGKISVKLEGTTENGAVYCHASMFKAYADCVTGDGDKAYETIIKTLPTNPENPADNSLQIPIYVPNFYFGLKDSPIFGRSSQHNSTGTCSWMMWNVLEHMLGAKSTFKGLEINPCIPKGWKEFSFERDYKESRYCFHIVNHNAVQTGVKEIIVNGKKVTGTLLPYHKNSIYQVDVVMG